MFVIASGRALMYESVASSFSELRSQPYPYTDMRALMGGGSIRESRLRVKSPEKIIGSSSSCTAMIVRHSTFANKGNPVKIQQVGKKTGVRYVWGQRVHGHTARPSRNEATWQPVILRLLHIRSQ